MEELPYDWPIAVGVIQEKQARRQPELQYPPPPGKRRIERGLGDDAQIAPRWALPAPDGPK